MAIDFLLAVPSKDDSANSLSSVNLPVLSKRGANKFLLSLVREVLLGLMGCTILAALNLWVAKRKEFLHLL